ncbi:hypothetical protein LSTR_LSTR002120 [Laodelphax striatellus]|uniref:Uncharacterized protein n=1 Tax=Laodelphax striatellus TaxID=195883 RepID=A0A482XQW0_LAOST|nr:hypothetical protein LSTR_LSTR002120 [Laodelphax striatellus]
MLANIKLQLCLIIYRNLSALSLAMPAGLLQVARSYLNCQLQTGFKVPPLNSKSNPCSSFKWLLTSSPPLETELCLPLISNHAPVHLIASFGSRVFLALIVCSYLAPAAVNRRKLVAVVAYQDCLTVKGSLCDKLYEVEKRHTGNKGITDRNRKQVSGRKTEGEGDNMLQNVTVVESNCSDAVYAALAFYWYSTSKTRYRRQCTFDLAEYLQAACRVYC